MSTYKLTYFDIRGRAEVARLLFVKSGTQFEDNRVDFFDEWPELKVKISKSKQLVTNSSYMHNCPMYKKVINLTFTFVIDISEFIWLGLLLCYERTTVDIF